MLEDLEKLFHVGQNEIKTNQVKEPGNTDKLEKIVFRITGQTTPTIQEKPIKCLGKWFNETMCDTESIAERRSQTGEWLETIVRSGLPGSYNAQCNQRGLLPALFGHCSKYHGRIAGKNHQQISWKMLNVPRVSEVSVYTAPGRNSSCRL